MPAPPELTMLSSYTSCWSTTTALVNIETVSSTGHATARLLLSCFVFKKWYLLTVH